VLSGFLDLPVEGLTWIFRFLVVALPVVVALVVYALCRSRQGRPAPGEVDKGGVALVRTPAGGWEEAER